MNGTDLDTVAGMKKQSEIQMHFPAVKINSTMTLAGQFARNLGCDHPIHIYKT